MKGTYSMPLIFEVFLQVVRKKKKSYKPIYHLPKTKFWMVTQN